MVVPRSWTEVIPIHAMLAEARVQPADQQVVVSHATSIGSCLESMTQSARAAGRPRDALVITNPRPSKLRVLTHAAWEHGALSATLDGIHILSETEAARKAALEGLAAGPDLFHYAGHATAGELLLAYDARLSVTDILRLTAPPPRLAVLSGCHTAIPASQSTEYEALSMARAFQDTRCPAVIGNLWEVDDLATALVVDAFYREVDDSGWDDLPAALSRATHWLRTATWRDAADRLEEIRAVNPAIPSWAISQIPERHHPYDDPDYWAPFVFYGA
jgi:CHAT domain-containing protein